MSTQSIDHSTGRNFTIQLKEKYLNKFTINLFSAHDVILFQTYKHLH